MGPVMRCVVLMVLAACVASADPIKPADPARPEPAKAGGSTGPDAPELRVLRLVDRYRKAVGLPAVVLDAKLSKGCMEHAEYMRLNRNTDAMVGLNAHQQRSNLPGASPEGAACGKAADLFPGVSDLEVAVDAWMSGLYHRRPILTPTLKKIGVGYAQLDDGSFMAALMFVDGTDPDAGARWPIAYPADKQGDIPLEFGNEVPNPVPGGGRAGYPITIQFPPFDKLTDVKAQLVDAAGKAVAFHLSDPEHPATSFGQYGVVCLIPKLPLQAKSRYEVRVDASWKGKPGTWSWSFTTLSLRAVDAHDEDAVTRALNVASTLRGTVLHGGMMDSDTAFLQIGLRKLKRYKMVSVLIPRDVWQAMGGKAAAFVGKTIEVEGTPHLVQSIYVNVPITVARQLRIVR